VALVVGSEEDLVEDLRRGEVAAKTHFPCGAKGTACRAAHHAGDADSLAACVGHVDGLGFLAVPKGIEVLYRAVLAYKGGYMGKLGDPIFLG